MKLIRSEKHNPYFNLAMEEWLLKQKEEYFFIWRNARSVIVGRNQNTIKEVNFEVAKKNNCSIVRRNTGGGTVFHDMGNINVSYVYDVDDENDKMVCLLRAIIGFLKTQGVDAEYTGKNDIMVNNKKISGCAQLERGKRGLVHCTLMCEVDLEILDSVLKVEGEKLCQKRIQSARYRVVNLNDFLLNKKSTNVLMNELENYLRKMFNTEFVILNEDDRKQINQLESEKYRSEKWNYNNDTPILCRKTKRFSCGTVEVAVSVDSHIINKCIITGDFIGVSPISELERKIEGSFFGKDALLERIKDFRLDRYFGKLSKKELCELFF